jgi:hypothetical protein
MRRDNFYGLKDTPLGWYKLPLVLAEVYRVTSSNRKLSENQRLPSDFLLVYRPSGKML